MNIGALLHTNPSRSLVAAATELPKPDGGFSELLAHILGPPGPEPPPDAGVTSGSEELKTNEPNAPSKKLDPAAPIQDPLALIAANLVGSSVGTLPVASEAPSAATVPVSTNVASVAGDAKPVVEVNVDAQAVTPTTPKALTDEQAALKDLLNTPDLGVSRVTIQQTPAAPQNILPPTLAHPALGNAPLGNPMAQASQLGQAAQTAQGNHPGAPTNFTITTPGSDLIQSIAGKDSSAKGSFDADQDNDSDAAEQDASENPTPDAISAAHGNASHATKADVAAAKEVASKDQTSLIAMANDHVERLAALHSRSFVTIHLDPKDVGEITLLIKQSDGQVEAQVNTDNEQVRQAIQNAQSHAVRHWESRGVQVNSITVGDLSGMNANGDFQSSHSSQQQQTAMQSHQQQFFATAPATTNPATTTDWTRNSSQGVDLSI